MRGPADFAERNERAKARRFIASARQNRFLRAPLRGAFGVLDPARSAQCARPVFEQKEGTMITLHEHIDELRAELRGCITRRERAAVEAELEAAIAAQKEQDRAAEANRPPG